MSFVTDWPYWLGCLAYMLGLAAWGLLAERRQRRLTTSADGGSNERKRR